MKWVQTKNKGKDDPDEPIMKRFSSVYGIDDIEDFMCPSSDHVHDRYILDNMVQATNCLIGHVTANNLISIYSDIDCDGITSTAILYNYLKHLTTNVTYFHSQRSEGHGIEHGYDKIPEGTKLLVILDSSTSSSLFCEMIRRDGIDIIIIDHHPPEMVNDHAIIVNNQMCDYPNKELSGAGMTYKFIEALDDKFGTGNDVDLIDLAGLGIHGDAMSMAEMENRWFLNASLANVKNIGLLAIFKQANKDIRRLCSNDYAFLVTPMINGAARLDKIELALQLLTTESPDEAKALAKELVKLNDMRKEKQKALATEYCESITKDDKIGIVSAVGSEKGFAGLVAQDLTKRFQKPVIIFTTLHDGVLSGSFRTFGDIKLKSVLGKCEGVVDTVGHQGAGGVSVEKSRLEEFIHSANVLLDKKVFEETSFYDIHIQPEDLSLKMMEQVEKFTRICGKGFPEVKFRVDGLETMDKKLMGKKLDTVKIECDAIDVMKFRTDETFYEEFPLYNKIDLIGSLNINRYYNFGLKQLVVTPQMFLEDYRIHKD